MNVIIKLEFILNVILCVCIHFNYFYIFAGKDQASLQEGKDRCTKSPIAEIFAENNKPQLSDQQQTCKPEIKPRTKHYKEQPQCPLELKKDN